MTKLAMLRSNLAGLRRKRQVVRWGTAYCALASLAVWILAAIFLVDFATESDAWFRGALLVAGALGVFFGFRALVRPWLGVAETDLDMALLVERQHGISSDLVAALQFESPKAAEWGSVQLEQIVIEDVAGYSRGLNVLEGFSTERMRRRGMMLAATAAAAAVAVAMFPDYAGAFLNRLLLGPRHYPTNTVIAKVLVNGRTVDVSPGARGVIECAEGEPLSIEVIGARELPAGGRVELVSLAGRRTAIALAPTVEADVLAELRRRGDRAEASYRGRLDRLGDPLAFQLYLGDAWTDPTHVKLIPLPVIEYTLVPTPPDYVRGSEQETSSAPGQRSINVLEGSQVAVELTSKNKRLTQVGLVVDEATYPLTAADSEGRRWRLDPKGTPLADVDKEVRYRIDAVDEDGMKPDGAAEGVIQIRTDGLPRVTATVRTRHVVPTGMPKIEYRMTDDYGVAKLQVRAVAVRETPNGRQRIEHPPIPIAPGRTTLPARTDKLPYTDTFTLRLEPLKLAKGDRLELALEAVDYRGSLPGKSTVTDPLVLNVTDASGVESAVTELDPQLEQQFNTLIQKQIDIGASK